MVEINLVWILFQSIDSINKIHGLQKQREKAETLFSDNLKYVK